MQRLSYDQMPKYKKILFSRIILENSTTRKVVYIAVMCALSIISNSFFSFSFFDVQFSLTIFVSMLAGVILGPIFGFCASFLGDVVGYIYNSWGMIYMPWVGLSTATFSLLAGLAFNLFPTRTWLTLALKMLVLAVLSLLICTIAINSVGFYFYNYYMGFSQAVISYCRSTFGSDATFFAYVAYRLIFKGQIFNSILNYALFFISVPLLNSIKPLKINIS